MKTILLFCRAVVVAAAFFLCAGCNDHDTSSLPKAVQGHWVSGETHYYIGPDRIVMDTNGHRKELAYTVLESDETKNWMVIRVLSKYGILHTKRLEFAPDRQRFSETSHLAGMVMGPNDWRYEDGDTIPDL